MLSLPIPPHQVEIFPIDIDDYAGVTDATITIPAGRTTPVNPISIEVIADEVPEPDETFNPNL